MASNSPPPEISLSDTPDLTEYWCHVCNKQVPVETVPDDDSSVLCFLCKGGFVESISVSVSSPHERIVSNEDVPAIGNEFIQVLRLIAQAAREEDDDEPPPPPSDRYADDDNDYLRIELDGWNNNDNNYIGTDEDEQEFRDHVRSRWYFGEDDDDDVDNEHEDDVIGREQNGDDDVIGREQIENRIEEEDDDERHEDDVIRGERHGDDDVLGREQIENRIDEEEEDERHGDDVIRREPHGDDGVIRREQIENRIEEEEEEEQQRGGDDVIRRENRRDVLRLRLRQVASRAASRHHRILDWAEMLMGLEDQSIEFRLQITGDDNDNDNNNNNNDDDDDAYVGNPGDYVDAAGYEALLETLAEGDLTDRRGPPPAAKSAVENLHTVEVKLKLSNCSEVCAVCKDEVFDNNEGRIVKQLECGHMYHSECIIPWLELRNTCPVCRFELPTDDVEYEEERKRRLMTVNGGYSSSTSGAVEYD